MHEIKGRAKRSTADVAVQADCLASFLREALGDSDAEMLAKDGATLFVLAQALATHADAFQLSLDETLAQASAVATDWICQDEPALAIAV